MGDKTLIITLHTSVVAYLLLDFTQKDNTRNYFYASSHSVYLNDAHAGVRLGRFHRLGHTNQYMSKHVCHKESETV